MKILVVLVVLAVVAGAVLWGMGAVSFSGGKVTVDMNKAEEGGMDAYGRAQVAYAGLQYSKAYELWQQAVKEQPTHAEAGTAHFCMAKCLKEMGKPTEAKEMYKRFIEKFPKDGRVGQATKEADTLGLMGN